MQYLPFCDWLMSLGIMSSKFIHAVAYYKISFLRLGNIPLYVYIFCLSVHLSVPIHPSLSPYIFIYHLSVLDVFISLRIIYTWILYEYNKVHLNLLEEELHWSSWVVLLLHGLLNWNNLIFLIKIGRMTASTFQMEATIVKIWALEITSLPESEKDKKIFSNFINFYLP